MRVSRFKILRYILNRGTCYNNYSCFFTLYGKCILYFKLRPLGLYTFYSLKNYSFIHVHMCIFLLLLCKKKKTTQFVLHGDRNIVL